MIIKSKLQDAYLDQLQTTKTPVIVHLLSGVQIKGKIIGNDIFTIVLEFEGKQQMLFKQMISTISPLRPVNLMEIQSSQKQGK
ncbi:RNA chaperone Hfq [Desulfosporosinus acidiphilus SJ4]|uniref:RNA chaperone Hfq n=1 Tax=Desulfosporosinus acidiphilus (strain DSM 22704 / JCM 16185 / SJ4) TaxID=646529 RepID=I4DB04_DESAJ|nr:RNA chaperone Hfq [Desulfosporosinus acidiphilus]AFM42978.1 RNA chaperone Hfq [Desulfosporosinus acidiphilus SJ4]